MGNIFFNVTALGVIATMIIMAFCLGVFVPTFAKSGASFLGRCVGFVRRRAGHFASFAAGGVLVAMFTMTTSPYYFAMWSNGYEAMTVGGVILSDETIMETGQVPQDVLDWYARRNVE